MYDHTKQYRCTIIRGKSQKEMDDFLPVYAKVIDEICPCSVEDFEVLFNNAFKKYLPESDRIKKTMDNHRTEISGKLFGMYYQAEDGKVYISERTQKFLQDFDQPAFFKDICYKMQFPNGSQKVGTTVQQRVNDKICIRPYAFLLKLLLIARKANIDITKREVGYYVLNSLDVLQGKASPYEVIEQIEKDKKNNIERTIHTAGKASSYNWQHINEQMNYLELANLIRITDDKRVILNTNELETIELFAKKYDQKPDFNVYSYNLGTIDGRKDFQFDWDYYFSKISDIAKNFTTPAVALTFDEDRTDDKTTNRPNNTQNLTALGDEGESVVYEYEKSRVSAFNKRLVNKVLALGKTKGLGYDIQSVIAEPGDFAEFVKYIEVKSTKRYTCPNVNDSLWLDTLNMTRNEWVAAQQHGKFYYIYRVYFTRNGIYIFVIANVADKINNGLMMSVPITYRIDFSNTSVDNVININI